MPIIPEGPYKGAEAHRIRLTREDDTTFLAADEKGPHENEHLQASIGGNDDVGYYLTFRGDPKKILKMLEMATAAAKHMLPRGRYYDNRTQR